MPAPSFETTDAEVVVIDAGDAGDPFVDVVSAFTPGIGAGFGQGNFPQVVFGPPQGTGDSMGSLDVLSLGRGGSITLEFTDFEVVDGTGVDFIVFENGFTGFLELAFVEVSADGTTWSTFPCAATIDGGTEGCAGAHVVYSNPTNGIPPTSPDAGGDGFDLAQLGVRSARFVRITDTGTNRFYAPPGGGFDLDAVAVVNSRQLVHHSDGGP